MKIIYILATFAICLNFLKAENPTPLSPEAAEEWLKNSKEQFDASSWSDSEEVTTLMKFLSLLEINDEMYTFFYNPDDSQTYGITPFFRTTCSMLSMSIPNIKNLTINMKENPDIANYFGIPIGYSTILYFYKKAPIIFKLNPMQQEKQPVDRWISNIKNKSKLVRKIEKEEDMDVFENSSTLILLLVNEQDIDLGETFSALSLNYPELTFAWMVKGEDTKDFEERINEDFGFESSENNRMISIKFEEEEYVTEEIKSKNVIEMASFISSYRFSRVMLLMDETVNKVFFERKPTVLLLLKSEGRIFKTFKKITSEYDNINVLYDNLSKSSGKQSLTQMMDILGLSASDLPVLIMLPFTDPQNGISAKYKTNELSAKNIKEFIDKGLKGELEYYKRSENVGDDIRLNGYATITLNNFEEVVLKSDKHFIVGFELIQTFTPPDFMDVVTSIQGSISTMGLQDKLDIGVCDLFKNEIGHVVQLQKVPEFILFKKVGEKHERIHYNGIIRIADVKRWLLEQLKEDNSEQKEIDL